LKEGANFYFGRNQGLDNGFRSLDYGITNCTVGGGLLEENYMPPREIRETFIRGNPKPYFHGADLKPMELSLTFAFESFHTGVTPKDKNRALRELTYWLTKDYYVPFGIVGQDFMFYVTSIGDSKLIHNASSQGYVEITLRTDAPWAYSEIKTMKLKLDPEIETMVDFENQGDLPIKPEIWADIPFISGGKGEFSIMKNNSQNTIFKFSDLLSQEKIYVNNEKEYIESLNTDFYRYDNFNNNYLSFDRGKTTLTVKGVSQLTMKYQERMVTAM